MLKIGYMLVYSENKPLEEKFRLVFNYYNRKAGKTPEFIVINDKIENVPEKYKDVDILRRPWIAKNYFWVGVYG
ncbi:MAG: hypothetical protein WC554_10230 [Clostridia bacterium]